MRNLESIGINCCYVPTRRTYCRVGGGAAINLYNQRINLQPRHHPPRTNNRVNSQFLKAALYQPKTFALARYSSVETSRQLPSPQSSKTCW
jgi:hypothetical protein